MELTVWQIALVPLLVLPFVLLFRFSGCGHMLAVDEADPEPAPDPGPKTPSGPVVPPTEVPPANLPPNYRKYILGEQPNPGVVKNTDVVPDGNAVIGYWRLVEPTGVTSALDEKALHDGEYVTGDPLDDVAPTAALGGSEAAAGNVVVAQPGLIVSDAGKLCRYYNGGYVRIPHFDGLHTAEFTLEAWVNLQTLKADYEHVLFDSGGRYALPGKPVADRGYRVLADRTGAWQMRLTSTAAGVFMTPPKVPLSARTHFALVMKNHDDDGVQKDVTIYIDGKEAATATLPTYNPPDTAALFIAAENTALAPTQAERIRAPFLGQIQEVVLHNKPLSVKELENHVDINR
jgi:hypothetical protein